MHLGYITSIWTGTVSLGSPRVCRLEIGSVGPSPSTLPDGRKGHSENAAIRTGAVLMYAFDRGTGINSFLPAFCCPRGTVKSFSF